MKEIPFKKLKRTPKNKFGSKNYGRQSKKLLVKGKKTWKEQKEKKRKEFKFEVPINKPASELLNVRKTTVQKYKIAMAYLAKRIIADVTLTDYQETLLGFMVEKCPLVFMTVRKYAAVTIMAIFDEILPEHKIVDNNKACDLKDDVRETYKREDIILKFYMKYLKRVLQNLDEAKKNKKDLAYQSLETTMVTCIANLFLKHSNFNYNKDLLSTITPYLSSPQSATRDVVYNIFVELLKADETGDMSLKIVQNIYTVVMKQKLQIHQCVVKILYHLRLEHLYNIDKVRFERKKLNSEKTHQELLLKKMKRKQGRSHFSRKERQEHKKDLYKKENKWLETKEELIKQQETNNTGVLQLTLGIYFLILKKKPKPMVISSVFEGLARYAHLINIEFFCDLIKVLDEFFSSKRLNTTDQLYCIQTVFTILNSQSESLAIDPYRFYIHLYNVLPNIVTGNNMENLQLCVSIFNLLFLQKKCSVISLPRVLALLKRFSSISCNMPNNTAMIVALSAVSKHLTNNLSNEILLDTDQQGWPGRFTMYNEEPDTANAGATSLWELHLTRLSSHPHVRQLSEAMIKGTIYNYENGFIKRLVNRNCQDLQNDYSLKKCVIHPGVPPPEEAVSNAKPKKTDDDFSFSNLEFHELCMNVMNEDVAGPPPLKKRKTDASLENETDASLENEMITENADFANAIDFSHYLIGGEIT